MDIVEWLHTSLDARIPPQTVAGLASQLLGPRLLRPEQRALDLAAQDPAAGYAAMSDGPARPWVLNHKVHMLDTLLGHPAELGEQRLTTLAEDPWVLRGQVATTGRMNGWKPGMPFRERLNRQQRLEAGVTLSKRQYNRLLRHLARTDRAATSLGRQILLRNLLLVGHVGLAQTITVDEMRADPDGAAAVAYWTAMRKQCSQSGNPDGWGFDVAAEMLLGRCERRGPATDWWMIALARPVPELVARLGDERRGELLGLWMSYMRVAAGMLKDLHAAWPDPVGLEVMAAANGVDSSTWNLVAGAYNAARDGWIRTLDACGALALLEVLCPGKAMRLTAAAADRQTLVWARLPLPWLVLSGGGDTPCPAGRVEQVCAGHGIDPHATGWTAPRPAGQVTVFTPELLHGIETRDPGWAAVLRSAGHPGTTAVTG